MRSLGDFPKTKTINFGKGKTAKDIKILQFLSNSASVTDNVHHNSAPRPLSSRRLDCPETRTVKVQSRSKKPVFSLNHSLKLTHTVTRKVGS